MSEENYWTRLQRRSVSRRTMLRGAAIGGAGLAGAALIGCGDDDDDGAAPTSTAEVIEAEAGEGAEAGAILEGGAEEGQFDWIFEAPPKNVPISGGTRVIATSSQFEHFSPFHLGGFSSGGGVYDSMYTQFFRGKQLILLRAIEQVERPDELTNILTVRDGGFGPNEHIGERRVDSEDIFEAMRLRFEDITAWNPGLYASTTDWDQTEVTDEKTVTLVLTRPRNDFFRTSDTTFPSKEASLLHLAGEKTLQEWENPAGSGPYYQTALTPGSKLEMTRNPNYGQAPWPYIENTKTITLADAATTEAQFRGGELDSLPVTNKALFEDILEDLGSGTTPRAYGVKFMNSSGGPPFALGSALRSPWDDIRAREAVTRSLDRQKAIDVLEQGDAILNGPGPVRFFENFNLPDDDPRLVDYLRHDPQRSRALLDALRADGVDVDRDMILVTIAGDTRMADRAVFAKQMLEEGGFNIVIETVPSAELSSKVLRRATCDFDFISTNSSGTDPGQHLRSYHTTSGYVSECVCMCDPELDAMIEDWEITIDEDEIARKARDIQVWLIEHWSTIIRWYQDFSRVVIKSTLRNINRENGDIDVFSWIDESYLEG